jgi:mono/diheme cytochrome c family protein
MPAPSRLGLLLLLAACGGGADRAKTTDTTAMSTPAGADTAPDTAVVPAATPAPAPAPQPDTTARKTPATKPSASKAQDTTKAATRQDTTKKAAKQDTTKAAAAKPVTKPGGGPLSPQQIALGDSIFHGQVGGGTCSACHGQDAKGTAVAPDLTDQQWINGDGSYDFIVRTVTDGVPQPKQHPAPMPPKGGAPLTDEQVKAVAAYVYSLSHKT